MSDEITFVVLGQPVVKGRPRFGNGRAYTPAATVEAEKSIREAYWKRSIEQYGRVVSFAGDITIHMVFHQSDRRRRDFDNLAKLVTDALNGVAYRDDSQIVNATIRKDSAQEVPCTLVIITGEVEK